MAQNQTLQHKRSTISGNVPLPSQVAVGELAINLGDRSIYTKTPAGVIIELAADVLTGPVFLGTPDIGDLWYNSNDGSLQAWDGVQWVNASATGKPVLPANTTSTTGFSGGSGTAASPYTYSANAAAGVTLFIDTITVTGLTPGQYVPIVDLNQVANGGRFSVDNYFANQSGTLIFTITYTDLPASVLGTVYTAAFKIGSGSVYFNTVISVGLPFPQTVNKPTNTLPVTTSWVSGSDTIGTNGDLLISLNGVTYGTGPLFITPGSTLFTRWTGSAGSGTGIDSPNGTTITGSIFGSGGGVTTGSLTIDKTQVPFTFTSQTGVALNAQVVSNLVTISGVNSFVYLTSANTMTASIAGGAYVSVPSTGTGMSLISGQTLRVSQTSSSLINTPTTVTLSVNGSNVTFQVTTGNNVINTPSITLPIAGAVGVAVNAQIVASAYSVTGTVGTHGSSDWEIYSDAALTTLVTSSMNSTTNLTSWTPSGLNFNSQYWVRVRYRSNDATPIVSEWSLVIDWTTIARVIDTPTIVSPVNGSVGIFPNATIVSSSYSFSGPVDTHQSSDWQIATDALFYTVVASSIASTTNLTTWTPSGLLGLTQYWVRVRYRSNDTTPVVSDWSPAVTWTTIAQTVVQPTISYPTNGSTNANADAVILSSAYVVTGSVGTHLNSDWEIYNNASLIGPVVDSSMASTVNLTSWQPSLLVAQNQYWVRVRYRSNDTPPVVSEWSPVIDWITATQPGVTWTNRTQLSTTSFGTDTVTDIAWSGTQYLVVGANGRAATSTDGVTWTYQSGIRSLNNDTRTAVIWNGSQYLTIGGRVTSSTFIATSTDGVSWTSGSISWGVGFGNSRAVNWNGSQYLVVGQFGRVATSPTGVTWTYQSGLSGTSWGTSDDVISVAWNGSIYVVVGENSKVATSPNGVAWTYRGVISGFTGMEASTVNWNGSQFIVGGWAGKIATSPDGVTWTDQPGLSATAWGATADVISVSWNGTQYLATGQSGRIATSPNGITWTNQTGLRSTTWGTTADVNAQIWNGSNYIVVGESGKTATSP